MMSAAQLRTLLKKKSQQNNMNDFYVLKEGAGKNKTP